MTTQVALIFGQLGQVLSALPFAALLHGAGLVDRVRRGRRHRAGRRGAGARVRGQQPRPAGGPRRWPRSGRSVAHVRAVWRRPGTRLGFFGHMGTQFSMMVFVVLWGVPYLVSGQGRTPGEAAALRHAFVLCDDRDRSRRRVPDRSGSRCAAPGSCSASSPPSATIWTAVLATPGARPALAARAARARAGRGRARRRWSASTSPARPIPSRNVAVAQSMVNVGGFLASLRRAGGDGHRADRARRLLPGGLPGRLAGAVPDLAVRGDRDPGDPPQGPPDRRGPRRRAPAAARGGRGGALHR